MSTKTRHGTEGIHKNERGSLICITIYALLLMRALRTSKMIIKKDYGDWIDNYYYTSPRDSDVFKSLTGSSCAVSLFSKSTTPSQKDFLTSSLLAQIHCSSILFHCCDLWRTKFDVIYREKLVFNFIDEQNLAFTMYLWFQPTYMKGNTTKQSWVVPLPCKKLLVALPMIKFHVIHLMFIQSHLQIWHAYKVKIVLSIWRYLCSQVFHLLYAAHINSNF